jgi:hypothetical protein
MTSRHLIIWKLTIGAMALLPIAAAQQTKAPEDSSALARFLVNAKTEGYASGVESRIRKLPDGGQEASFTEGDYAYRDRWYGDSQFSGEEIVHHKSKPVWSMNFYGWTEGTHIPAEFPKFHKAALRRVTAETPFRGPAFYQEGDFAYTNDVTGSIHNFSGVERVFYQGKEIFRLLYHGGDLR